VVGIVGDVKSYGLDEETPAQAYEPYLQQPFPFMTLVVRTTGNPIGLNEAIRREVLNIDKEQPVFSINTLDQLIANSIAQKRFSVFLLGIFAAIAMILAAVGLYGVMSYTVTQRTQEIGIRIALGAQQGHVLKLIVGQGLLLTLTGITLGLIAAFVLTRLLSGLLFGVSTTDPMTFVLISMFLLVVSLLACFLPARRAAKVDPIVALRYE